MSGAVSATAVALGASAATAATAGTIGTGLAVAGTLAGAGLSAVGSIEQGKAASAAAGYNAQVASNNAQIATQNAQMAGGEGEQNVAAAQSKTRAQIGATLANQGASGVNIGSGSDVDTRVSESKLGMLNALNVRSEAARTAYGYQTQTASDTGQAALNRSQASSDQTAGYINAGSTILGGVGKAGQFTPSGSGGSGGTPNATPAFNNYVQSGSIINTSPLSNFSVGY